MLGLNILCLRKRRGRSQAWSPPKDKPAAVARVKKTECRKHSPGRQMAPTPPLPVTEDTPPDMLAGSMDLRVVLPGGHSVKMSVERSTPMMDLLVQATTANKIAPGGHVLQAVGERGTLPYKPNTPIGALDTWTIQIVPKTRGFATASLKKAPLKPSNQQPFEQTFRLQVHLPRNQLFVARVSPKTLLSDVLHQACTEKNLDPNKYELRHPANLEERLRPDYTLADYKLQEVTLVAKGGRPPGAGLSSSDIMALQKEEEKRRQQARAAGGTGSAGLGLMFNKRSRSSVCDGSISSDSLGGRSVSPAHSDETPSPPGSSLPPPRPARKRRPAPKPPTQQAAVISHSRNSSDSSGYHEASVLSESPESNGLGPDGTLPRRSKLTSAVPSQPTGNLSRSLSNLTSVSASVNNKTAAQAADNMRSCQHSVSTSSLTSGKKKKAAPPPPPVVLPKTATIVEEVRMQPQRTASLSTLSSQSSVDSYARDIRLADPLSEGNTAEKTASLPTPIKQKEATEGQAGMPQRKTSPKSASLERQTTAVAPVAQAVLERTSEVTVEYPAIDVRSQLSDLPSNSSSGKSTPERLANDRDNSSEPWSEPSSGKSTPDRRIVGHNEPFLETVNQPSEVRRDAVNDWDHATESLATGLNSHVIEAKVHETSSLASEAEPEKLAQPPQHLPVDASKVDKPQALLVAAQGDLEAETEEVQRAFQHMTEELEAAICTDEAKEALPAPPSPEPDCASASIADWEYQLPAPPSAFRDLSDSPTPTHGGTVVLADTAVFEESSLASECQSPPPPLDPLPLDFHSLPLERTDSLSRLSFQDDLEESITKTNPVFDAQKFEEEIVRQQAEEVKERLNRVRETNASLMSDTLDDDDDWEPQLLTEEPMQPDVERRNSFNNPTPRSFGNDPSHSNQLKNFTITTYQRPRDMDAIFDGESDQEDREFKKPVPTAVYSKQRSSTNPRKSSNLPRTNSFNANNGDASESPSVKRSTSYISLVNPGRSVRTKSIGNISASAGERESTETEGHAADDHGRLRKTTSEVNVSQGAPENYRLADLQDQFLLWQQQVLRQSEPDLPLQSLQVLRSILNPVLAPSQEHISVLPPSEDRTAAPTPVQEPVVICAVQERVAASPTPVQEEASIPDKAVQVLSRSSTLPRAADDVDVTVSAPPQNTTTTTTLDQRLNAPNESSKRYSYQGPPAVNFTTWSERPKSQVSIKVDSDYRIGKGQGGTGSQPPVQEPQPVSVARLEADEVDSPAEEPKPSRTQTAKVEPTPLTMRIISHTTASGYKRTPFQSSRINFMSTAEEPALQSNSKESKPTYQGPRVVGYNPAQAADPSRVPIVRAVELKKSFVQSANGERNSGGTQLNWDELDQGRCRNKNIDQENDPPETYKGVNSLAKRFSVGAPSRDNVRVGFRASSARPVSAYLYNGASETSEPSSLRQNSVSTSNLQNVGESVGASTVSQSNINGPRKYTSVVGINGAGLTGYREPSVEVNRVQPPRISNSASVKVNGFTAPKQPMPVVKGFRFAPASGTNHSDMTTKTVSSAEPPAVRIQRTSVYTSQNQRSLAEPTPSFNIRIQHAPVSRADPPVVRVQQLGSAAPAPPPAPVLRAVASRSKSFPVPEVYPRDQLMDAIRSFGGRNNLRQSGETE